MKHTIQQLREARGESRETLAAALGTSVEEVTAWELGRAEPTITYLTALTTHFDVRDDQINFRPQDPPRSAIVSPTCCNRASND